MVCTRVHILSVVQHVAIDACITIGEVVHPETLVLVGTHIQLTHVVAVIGRVVGCHNILRRVGTYRRTALVNLLDEEMTPLGICVRQIGISLEVGFDNVLLLLSQRVRHYPSTISLRVAACGERSPLVSISIDVTAGGGIVNTSISTTCHST